MEMAVLPVGIFDVGVAVADRRGGQDRDPIPAHDAHELAAAAREFFSVHRIPSSVQALCGRIDLAAQRQEFLEDHLCRDADELDEFHVGLLVRLVCIGIVACSA